MLHLQQNTQVLRITPSSTGSSTGRTREARTLRLAGIRHEKGSWLMVPVEEGWGGVRRRRGGHPRWGREG